MVDFLNSCRATLLALLSAGCIATCGALADPSTCGSHPTDVRISLQVAPTRVDDTRTESELAAMHFSQSVASDRRFLQLTGLTVAGIAVDQEIRFARSGPNCIWPSVVTVTLSTAPTIYLVRSRGQCLLTLGLTHERRHVAVNDDVLKRYAVEFRNRVGTMTDAIVSARPTPSGDADTLRSRMEEEIAAMVSVTSDRLYDDWSTDQRAVDTPAEYRRISNACGSVTTVPTPMLQMYGAPHT